MTKVLPAHVFKATPASQIDHDEYVERIGSGIDMDDELPATKAEKKKKKRKKRDELPDLTEPEALAIDCTTASFMPRQLQCRGRV